MTKKSTPVKWIKTTPNNLPNHKQRVVFYRPTKLTKIGEMIYFKEDKAYFLKEITHWAHKLQKP